MSVREYIAELQKLDQDKGIWVVYDGVCRAFDPVPDDVADDDLAAYFNKHYGLAMKEGDYIINAS